MATQTRLEATTKYTASITSFVDVVSAAMHVIPRVVYSRLIGDPQKPHEFVETHLLSVALFCYQLFHVLSRSGKYSVLPNELIDCIVDLASSLEVSNNLQEHSDEKASIHRTWVVQQAAGKRMQVETTYASGYRRMSDKLLYNNRIAGYLFYPGSHSEEAVFAHTDIRALLDMHPIGGRRFIVQTKLHLYNRVSEWSIFCIRGAAEYAVYADMLMQSIVCAARDGYNASTLHNGGRYFIQIVSTLCLGADFMTSRELGSVIQWRIRFPPIKISLSIVVSSRNNDRYVTITHLSHDTTARFLRHAISTAEMSKWIAITASLTAVSTARYFSFGMLVDGRKRKLWVTVDRINMNCVLAICYFRRNGYCHIMYREQFAGCQLVPVDAMVYMPDTECDVELRDRLFCPTFYPVQLKMLTM